MPKQKDIGPEEIYRQIGEKIKELRFKAGFESYETFANEFDLDRKQYWRMEAGANITIKSLHRVLQVHGMSLRDFFKDSRFQ